MLSEECNMTVPLKPKLLDVVKFKNLTGEHQGTIVEIFGSEAALVEIADENGVAKDFLSVPLPDLEVVWSSPLN